MGLLYIIWSEPSPIFPSFRTGSTLDNSVTDITRILSRCPDFMCACLHSSFSPTLRQGSSCLSIPFPISFLASGSRWNQNYVRSRDLDAPQGYFRPIRSTAQFPFIRKGILRNHSFFHALITSPDYSHSYIKQMP
jgi:hypothetical protein